MKQVFNVFSDFFPVKFVKRLLNSAINFGNLFLKADDPPFKIRKPIHDNFDFAFDQELNKILL